MADPLTLKSDMKITIPESIISASNLNVKKPIFLYSGEDYFFSNKKYKNLECYGEIKLDSTYSFIASENFIKLFGDIGKKIYFHYHTQKGILYISYTNADSYWYGIAPTDYKVQIPSELVLANSVNFKKPVYMYRYNYGFHNCCLYLSNESFCINHHICLGKITLDCENCFTFPATAYKFTDIRDNSICISTDNTDKHFIYKLLGRKRIILKNN